MALKRTRVNRALQERMFLLNRRHRERARPSAKAVFSIEKVGESQAPAPSLSLSLSLSRMKMTMMTYIQRGERLSLSLSLSRRALVRGNLSLSLSLSVSNMDGRIERFVLPLPLELERSARGLRA